MRRLSTLILISFIACSATFADTAQQKALSMKTFQFKFKDAEKAAGVIKSLMSSDGSLSIQPSSNTLIVTDRAENLKAVSSALAKFDVAAQQFKLVVRIVAASRVDPASAPRVPEDLKDVAQKLSMLKFNAFEDLGEANVQGQEGEPGIIELKSGYRADFHFGEFDSSSNTIKVNDFRLSRVQGPQRTELSQLLKTSLNLTIGQTVIVGASKDPQSQRALMIVVLARRPVA